ncbi:spore coat protein GerQ [Bacillus infantis]|uniref:spore coat protein GerQ n=1 Tax=Bacillus infantis TaxID=324767 RepID=UPI0021558BBF|nr:spore coat protein GerQ [Bacillus infantis]MCR6613116.1 spore coat protein GerQ [Bacillus infantis]
MKQQSVPQQQYVDYRTYPPYQQQPQQQQPYYGAGTQAQGYGAQQAYPQMPSGSMLTTSPTTGVSPAAQVPGMLPIEQSYIENILRLNKGKLATVYATFENNREWNAKIFKGIIEAAGRDHLILSDPQSGTRYLIPMIYLDYITFDEEIEYDYPYGAAPGLAAFPPR